MTNGHMWLVATVLGSNSPTFYARRSQKPKKDSQLKQLFALLGPAEVKATCKHVDEIDPRTTTLPYAMHQKRNIINLQAYKLLWNWSESWRNWNLIFWRNIQFVQALRCIIRRTLWRILRATCRSESVTKVKSETAFVLARTKGQFPQTCFIPSLYQKKS